MGRPRFKITREKIEYLEEALKRNLIPFEKIEIEKYLEWCHGSFRDFTMVVKTTECLNAAKQLLTCTTWKEALDLFPHKKMHFKCLTLEEKQWLGLERLRNLLLKCPGYICKGYRFVKRFIKDDYEIVYVEFPIKDQEIDLFIRDTGEFTTFEQYKDYFLKKYPNRRQFDKELVRMGYKIPESIQPFQSNSNALETRVKALETAVKHLTQQIITITRSINGNN